MNIIFDLDSTLCKIEGIDELAALKNKRNEVEKLTCEAMEGKINLEDVFVKRLEIIQPNKKDLEKIGQMYLENITHNAKLAINALQKNNRVFIVTGGYGVCALPLARELGVDESRVFANELYFDDCGEFAGLCESIPLWKNGGKKIIVEQIKIHYPDTTIMIGDGMSDLEAGADKFIYFAGVVLREEVARHADFMIQDLTELLDLVKTLDYVNADNRVPQKDTISMYIGN
jgi:phosphoserine phosphatase